MSRMENILVTGGAGFIGLHLVKRLLSSNKNRYKLVVIDDLSGSNEKSLSSDRHIIKTRDRPYAFYNEDIRNRSAVSEIISKERIDTCFHLAARVNVPYSFENSGDIIDVNVKGTLETLEACSRNSVENLIFASSAAVYGNPERLPLTEDHPLQPLSTYGASKVAGEALVSSYKHTDRIRNATSLRIFNVYGPGQNQAYAGVITNFAKRIKHNHAPVVYGDGMQTRDFIHVADVVECLILAAQNLEKRKIPDKDIPLSSSSFLPSGVFNVGTGVPTNISTLAKKMITIFGSKMQPIYDGKRNQKEIRYSYANTTKSRYFLKFRAHEKLDSGLRQITKQV
jgi:UDP-glucose 4-epimerase